ncbi:hypothetical protein N7461_006135 [Penicillium sp. DV-2018c]|nr:hypothetical protein N7461_006135 [Penicillium sp. DV-2018c]
METDSHHGGPDSDYAHSPWVIGAFASPHQSPSTHEYSGFDYGPSPLMAVDTLYGISIPPPYTSMPLPMPSHSWPSMLTTHNPFSAGMPVSTPTSVSPSAPMRPVRKTSTGGSARKILTYEDRRKMCLYHLKHPSAKQAQIAGKHIILAGMDPADQLYSIIWSREKVLSQQSHHMELNSNLTYNSTVSKVLCQKDKYLNPNDGSRSPIKRAKGKVPDIEKALSNWAKTCQRKGYPLSDEIIREKALFFASTCLCPEAKQKVQTTDWLEKFKRKIGLLGPKLRRDSTDIHSDSNSPTQLTTDFNSPSNVPQDHPQPPQ